MPFFQNPFENDFIAPLLMDDRQYVVEFRVPANKNKCTNMVAWADPPYNTVGNTTLTIYYSIDTGRTWHTLTVSLTSGSARTTDEIVADLNASTDFSNWFTAEAIPAIMPDGVRKIRVLARQRRELWKCFIANTGAETVLRFNAKAGVAELPSYFDRHSVTNYITSGPVTGSNAYPDSLASIVKLTIPTDNYYITAAGFTATAQKDWQLLRGRAYGNYKFQNITTDAGSSHRITEILEYPAGAKAGDLARKIEYVYDGGNSTSQPNFIFECPYVLQSGDLATLPSIST